MTSPFLRRVNESVKEAIADEITTFNNAAHASLPRSDQPTLERKPPPAESTFRRGR